MSAEISIVRIREISDQATSQLAHNVANVAGKHLIPRHVYSMTTVPCELATDIFTAHFSVIQEVNGGKPGFSQVNRTTSDIGHFKPNITVAEHLKLFTSSHPDAAIVLDNKTAIRLGDDKNRHVALIDYGDGHCLLTGLSARGIDVFLTPDVAYTTKIGNVSVTHFSDN